MSQIFAGEERADDRPGFLGPRCTFTITMALAKKHAGHRLGDCTDPYVVELFLDYVCPFSAKLFRTVYTQVHPTISSTDHDCIQFVFRNQIQPWHPSSTLTHEASLAIEMIDKSLFWDYSDVLFQRQKEYFDTAVSGETRIETYRRLARLAKEECGVDEGRMMELLEVKDVGKGSKEGTNGGNKVTDALKLMQKYNRQNSIHVTPTVTFNGVVDNSVSSSWDVDQWTDWLKEKMARGRWWECLHIGCYGSSFVCMIMLL
ncbi:hypothetical protein G7K_5356-t1 [Saitoella complicata NRRL Y-17804]|uniref:Thioredoxin-like fold domain-containing protein n=1 Tax=Saitoella complicata (strain BCRC 22490 / CBS 7301 / JCM 7358 / NBRC 10748 / NRRL Y-17804) TaxID=698492 RepID=A0A0E9NN68_SAICN|nr:hypothetical protein G7K_5356-t1 [Saitoella complicata NRRL Y-17804]